MNFMQIAGARNPRDYFRFRLRPSVVDEIQHYLQMTEKVNPLYLHTICFQRRGSTTRIAEICDAILYTRFTREIVKCEPVY